MGSLGRVTFICKYVFDDCIGKASERGVTPQREVQGGDTNRGLPVQSC